jgi:hypothetical protein
MVIKRNRTLMGLPWIPGDARGTTRHLAALDDGTQAPSDNPEVNAGSHTLHSSTGEMIQSGECTVAFQPSPPVVKQEPESKPDEHRARRPVERMCYGRPT